MADTTQIVVVGGGLAGFAAALQAAELGADVVLLEKEAACGGSSAMSGGCMAFAGTDMQREQGIADSDELLFQDLRDVGDFENDEALVSTYVEHQLETYEWLRGHGVVFAMIEAASGQSVPRSHTVDPADMVRALAARCRDSGKVRVVTSARAERLLRSDACGRVNAVVVEKDGERFTLGASRAVVLASGGFCQNRELLHRFVPDYDGAMVIGGAGNVGDGLRMAWRLGADFRDMAYVKGTYGMHPIDTRNTYACLAVYKGAIAVNEAGKRFVDESISYKLLGDAVLRQPNGSSYQILDQGIFETGENRSRILNFDIRLEEGLFVQAPTLEQLARRIEVPADSLQDTVARYNGFVDSGHDVDFGRRHLVHNYGELRRIERPPFYAYPSSTVIYGTYCGVCVDTGMRVIDVFGEPIDGLFAAGEIVGGLHGAGYMTGSSLGKASIFGRIAVRTALEAQRLQREP